MQKHFDCPGPLITVWARVPYPSLIASTFDHATELKADDQFWVSDPSPQLFPHCPKLA